MAAEEDRPLFEPIGEQSRRAMIHEGIGSMHLEPNTIITYGMISEWIREPFPIARPSRGGQFLEPDYGPMGLVKKDLLCGRGLLLLSETNVGYRVATDVEKVQEGEAAYRKAQEHLASAGLIARSVRSDRVGQGDALRASMLQRDVADENRVLTAKARERAKEANRW